VVLALLLVIAVPFSLALPTLPALPALPALSLSLALAVSLPLPLPLRRRCPPRSGTDGDDEGRGEAAPMGSWLCAGLWGCTTTGENTGAWRA